MTLIDNKQNVNGDTEGKERSSFGGTWLDPGGPAFGNLKPLKPKDDSEPPNICRG